jgi:uncharacterized paraquat-inducible protein A
MSFKEKLAKFMAGRYGWDRLNRLLSIVANAGVILSLIFGIFSSSKAMTAVSTALLVISIAAFVFCIFRMMSRKQAARRAEEQWYMRSIAAPVSKKLRELKTRAKQRSTHKFYKCPECGQTVRVPKGRGKIKITCPKCGKTFIKKT